MMKNPLNPERKVVYKTASSEETFLLGKTLAKKLSVNTVIALCGDLGAGKTTLIKGIAAEIGGIDPREICSPTFTFLNIYSGKLPIYHFDLYRLPSSTAFLGAGFNEYFDAGGICCIEWAEKIAEQLPSNTLFLQFSYSGASQRDIEITGFNS